MPSKFILASSVAIFIAIILLTVYFIESRRKKDKQLIIKRIKLKCEECKNVEVYNEVNVMDIPKIFPCNNNECPKKGINRIVVEYIN